MKDFRFEHFKTVYDFDKAMKERAINPSMERAVDCGGSRSLGNSKWYQTKSYEEAQGLLENGWNAKIGDMKKELEKFSLSITRERTVQYKNYAGFVPCIPNAIRGVPKTMYATKKVKTNKEKTLHIVLNSTGSQSNEGDVLMNAGLTVLKLSMVLNKVGVKTKIDVIPFMSFKGNSYYGCSVNIKDYRQPFNLSKMAYPISHTSFFRRHGFRFIETQEGDVEKFVQTYGYPVYSAEEKDKKEYLKYCGILDKGVVYIDLKDIKKANFDPFKLAELKDIQIKGGK